MAMYWYIILKMIIAFLTFQHTLHVKSPFLLFVKKGLPFLQYRNLLHCDYSRSIATLTSCWIVSNCWTTL